MVFASQIRVFHANPHFRFSVGLIHFIRKSCFGSKLQRQDVLISNRRTISQSSPKCRSIDTASSMRMDAKTALSHCTHFFLASKRLDDLQAGLAPVPEGDMWLKDGKVRVYCTDWSKETEIEFEYSDNLRLEIATNNYLNWLDNEAYK